MSMGSMGNISDATLMSADATGQNVLPGNVVGNMGQPTASGMGGAANSMPGNAIGVNPMGGTGGGYNTGAPYMGNNGASGQFGKSSGPVFQTGAAQAGLGGQFGKSGGPVYQTNPPTISAPVTQGSIGGGFGKSSSPVYQTNPPVSNPPNLVRGNPYDIKQPLNQAIRIPPMQAYIGAPPMGYMPPGNPIRTKPAQVPVTRPVITRPIYQPTRGPALPARQMLGRP